MEKKDTFLKVIVSILYIAVIFVNSAISLKPFGVKSIKEISDSYPNLLTPASFTFAIWGVIYLLLLVFVIYQLHLFGKNRHRNEKEILHQARIVFIVTGLLNIAWITAWVSDYMALSVMIIWGIQITLRIFGKQLTKEYLAEREKLLIRLPFSLYYGWITLAAILNIVILLVSIGWNIFDFSASAWIIILMIIITLVGTYRMLRNKDIAYGLALLWGYFGILQIHISADGWNGAYPEAIISVLAGTTVLAGGIAYLLVLKKRKAI